MTFIGLSLFALGSGGISPCLRALCGDQFQLPEQERQLQTYFSIVYFTANVGWVVSYMIGPNLREVECLGETSCYSLAFGTSTGMMFVALFIFVLGKPLYKMNPPEGNILFKVIGSIGTALRRNIAGERGENHWLDVSKEKYGEQLVEDVKCLLRILLLYTPVPVWFSLFDQLSSRWTFQAARMDGSLGPLTIKPEQMVVINPILILILLPIFDRIIYPLCAKCNILVKPLQRMCLGASICAVSFVVSGLLELQLQKTYAVMPGESSADLHLMNTIDCPVMVNIKMEEDSIVTERIEMLGNKVLHSLAPGSYSLDLSVEESCQSVRTSSELLELEGGEVTGVLLSLSDGALWSSVISRPEEPEKDSSGDGKVRVVHDLGDVEELPSANLTLVGEQDRYDFDLTSFNYSSVSPGDYRSVRERSESNIFYSQSLSDFCSTRTIWAAARWSRAGSTPWWCPGTRGPSSTLSPRPTPFTCSGSSLSTSSSPSARSCSPSPAWSSPTARPRPP